ncbi:hypothetical protein KKA14_15730 [bacterium]|nr:hypothetical protein [bacterium]
MNINEINKTILIAHRGYRAKFPENTMASFKGALEIGAEMIELDVALSKDRALVILHDDTLERTTNGKGNVSDYTLKELRNLDAGSWFDSRFTDEKIPTLEEVLDLVKNRSLLNIEIKECFYEDHNPADSIEKQVVELVRKKEMVDSVLISSFEINYFERLCKMENIPATAFLSRKPADSDMVETCKSLNLYSWNPWHEILSEEQVKMMHDAGLRVFSFTVNTKEVLKNLKSMGVDGVFTDDIPLISI